jgi:hypothetical protein
VHIYGNVWLCFAVFMSVCSQWTSITARFLFGKCAFLRAHVFTLVMTNMAISHCLLLIRDQWIRPGDPQHCMLVPWHEMLKNGSNYIDTWNKSEVRPQIRNAGIDVCNLGPTLKSRGLSGAEMLILWIRTPEQLFELRLVRIHKTISSIRENGK